MITPQQFCDAQVGPGSSLCAKLKKFFSLPALLCEGWAQIFGEDGNPTSEFQASLTEVAMPTGAVIAMAGTLVPANYLACNGQAVSRTTYAALFSVIATLHGPGDGIGTFNVPNYNNRVLRGSGGGEVVGDTGGSDQVTLTEANLPSHSHDTVTRRGQGGALGTPTSALVCYPEVNTANPLSSLTSENTGGGSPFDIIPRCAVVLFVIKT